MKTNFGNVSEGRYFRLENKVYRKVQIVIDNDGPYNSVIVSAIDHTNNMEHSYLKKEAEVEVLRTISIIICDACGRSYDIGYEPNMSPLGMFHLFICSKCKDDRIALHKALQKGLDEQNKVLTILTREGY